MKLLRSKVKRTTSLALVESMKVRRNKNRRTTWTICWNLSWSFWTILKKWIEKVSATFKCYTQSSVFSKKPSCWACGKPLANLDTSFLFWSKTSSKLTAISCSKNLTILPRKDTTLEKSGSIIARKAWGRTNLKLHWLLTAKAKPPRYSSTWTRWK